MLLVLDSLSLSSLSQFVNRESGLDVKNCELSFVAPNDVASSDRISTVAIPPP